MCFELRTRRSLFSEHIVSCLSFSEDNCKNNWETNLWLRCSSNQLCPSNIFWVWFPYPHSQLLGFLHLLNPLCVCLLVFIMVCIFWSSFGEWDEQYKHGKKVRWVPRQIDGRPTDGWTDRWVDGFTQIYRWRDNQTNEQAHGQMDKKTDNWVDSQVNRQNSPDSCMDWLWQTPTSATWALWEWLLTIRNTTPRAERPRRSSKDQQFGTCHWVGSLITSQWGGYLVSKEGEEWLNANPGLMFHPPPLSGLALLPWLSSPPFYLPPKGTQVANMTLCAVRSRSALSDSVPPHGSPPGSSVHRISRQEYTGTGCHFLLQGIFLTQGSNLFLLHLCVGNQILHHWATWEAPHGLTWFLSCMHELLLSFPTCHLQLDFRYP